MDGQDGRKVSWPFQCQEGSEVVMDCMKPGGPRLIDENLAIQEVVL